MLFIHEIYIPLYIHYNFSRTLKTISHFYRFPSFFFLLSSFLKALAKLPLKKGKESLPQIFELFKNTDKLYMQELLLNVFDDYLWNRSFFHFFFFFVTHLRKTARRICLNIYLRYLDERLEEKIEI